MPRMVQCRKYNQQLPGLPLPPYPGPKGQQIYDSVSQKAWDEWQGHQTMLINEKHLNLANPDDRKYLQQQMDLFLNNEKFDRAEGYVPQSE